MFALINFLPYPALNARQGAINLNASNGATPSLLTLMSVAEITCYPPGTVYDARKDI